jgi:glutamate dehydrogenase
MYIVDKKNTTQGESFNKRFVDEANLIYILPRTSLSPLFKEGAIMAKEYAYAYAAWKFAFHFLSRQTSEFTGIA